MINHNIVIMIMMKEFVEELQYNHHAIKFLEKNHVIKQFVLGKIINV
jgi:hypothetical protein